MKITKVTGSPNGLHEVIRDYSLVAEIYKDNTPGPRPGSFYTIWRITPAGKPLGTGAYFSTLRAAKDYVSRTF